jgi:drug/metabolite transporter (DMT)-like permease
VLTGLLLAILASVIHATADAAKKGLTRRQRPVDALTGYILFGLPLSALLWAVTGLPGMPREGFLLYATLSVVPNLLANILFFEAVRVSPLSLTLPFLAFTPAFLIGTSFVINRELPSLLGAAGILLVLVGALLLHAGELRHGAAGPLKAILRERGSLLMTAVALLWSFTAAADKQAVLRSGPAAYLTLWHVGLLVPLLAAAVARRRIGAVLSPRTALTTSGAAALHVAGMAVQLAALPLLQASYVIAIKRAGMVVGIFYGWLLFEEERVRERLLGAAVMVAGVLCITMG